MAQCTAKIGIYRITILSVKFKKTFITNYWIVLNTETEVNNDKKIFVIRNLVNQTLDKK